MNYYQIAILFLQGALVSFVILLLFRLRKRLGLGILFACLGLFQFMQVFLSSTVYVSVAEGILVSPGSTVLFTATLFALLIIYIKEDARETRKIIYALLMVNIVMSILIRTFGWNLEESSLYNPFNVSTNLFDNSAWVLFVGTVALFLDSLLIIIIYEYLSRHIRSVFFSICITMLLVVSFDTLFFSVLAFWRFDSLQTILLSGLISKGLIAVFYSIIFYLYLKYFDALRSNSKLFKVKDVFEMLSYKQKFEAVKNDVEKASKEIEHKHIHYQTLTDNSPVGIFQARSDGYTTFVNPRWCEISSLSASEALGYGWLNAVHPDDRDAITQEWDASLAEKRRSRVNYRFVSNDGSIRWVLGQSVPEYNRQNQLIGFVGTITDITELKVYQQEQELLRKKADESNRLKSAFLANMSHEIRTPMNGILGFSSLLNMPNLSSEDQKTYIKSIEASSVRMLNILNDIISISRIEAGAVDVVHNTLNINSQVEELYTLFKTEVSAKKLDFSYSCALPSEDSDIKTDPEKFMSIFTNLIKNAIKYTERGSIEFGYTKSENFYEFFVKDTGIGIEVERQEAIFERFVQADIEDKMAMQGAGIGLSIAKSYTEMLGGKIWLESEIGKGSEFYFTLPFIVSNQIEETPAVHQNEDMETKIKDLKILVAEDDELSGTLFTLMFQKTNSKIFHAKNGVEALEFCQENPDLDLILMDIKMPLMDGYEATRRIRKFNKNVLIVAQTAYAMQGDDKKAILAGCDKHLPKPILKDELFAELESLLLDRKNTN